MYKHLFILTFLLLSTSVFAQAYKIQKTLAQATQGIECMAVSPHEALMVTGGTEGELLWWDLNDYSVTRRVQAHQASISSIIFNASGSKFVTAGADGQIKLWDSSSGKLLGRYFAPYNSVNFALLGPDEKYIYFGGYNLEMSPLINPTANFTGFYRVSRYNPYNRELLYIIPKETVHVWGITDGNLDYSGQNILFTAGHYIYVWNIARERLVETIECPLSANNLRLTRNTMYVWAEGFLYKYRIRNGSFSLTNNTKAVKDTTGLGYSHIAVSDDGKLIVSGDRESGAVVWNSSYLTANQILEGHHSVVRTFAFIHHDSILLTASYDGTIKVWGYPEVRIQEQPLEIEKPQPKPEPEVAETEKVDKKSPTVEMTEHNIPLTLNDRIVEKQGTVEVNSEDIKVIVWDQSIVDNDTISLSFNGKWILKNYPLSAEKKIIKIDLQPNTNNYLVLYAKNMGQIPPNTATIAVRNSDGTQILTLSSDLKKCGAINFLRK